MSEAKKLPSDDELELSALRALKAIVDIPVRETINLDSHTRAAKLLLRYVQRKG